MLTNLLTLTLAAFAFGQEDETPSTASVTDDEMGPAAFMWPQDRVWAGDMDNTSPCGSRAASGNRTEFPLTGGAIALVAQDDYYNSKISISYLNDPTSNEDFTILIEEKSIADLNPGHTCVEVPDAPSGVSAGDNATLQIVYRADWDAPHNQTFYACADITFVTASDFTFNIPCFNATEPGEDDKEAGVTATASATATHRVNSSGASGESEDSDSGSNKGGSKKLSGGAIAGIVIGSLVGAILIGGAALFLWRRRKQQQRIERIARMENNVRNHDLASGKGSGSQNSLQLSNLNTGN